MRTSINTNKKPPEGGRVQLSYNAISRACKLIHRGSRLSLGLILPCTFLAFINQLIQVFQVDNIF